MKKSRLLTSLTVTNIKMANGSKWTSVKAEKIVGDYGLSLTTAGFNLKRKRVWILNIGFGGTFMIGYSELVLPIRQLSFLG